MFLLLENHLNTETYITWVQECGDGTHRISDPVGQKAHYFLKYSSDSFPIGRKYQEVAQKFNEQ